MNKIIYSLIFTIFVYLLVTVLCRIMGRKLISQMTFFDFVVGVSIGSTMANLALGPNSTPSSVSVVLLVLTGLTV